MKFIRRLFQRKPKFFPVLAELGPELNKRYGSRCFQGQIDKTLDDLEIQKELKEYAYALFLRDEDYKVKKAEAEDKFKNIEKEIEDYLKTRPSALGRGNFYESRIAITSAAVSSMGR